MARDNRRWIGIVLGAALVPGSRAAAQEGAPPACVLAVQIEGNRALSDKRLRKALAIRPTGKVVDPPPETARFDEAKWPAEREKLERVYQDYGYLTAKIGAPQVFERVVKPNARWVALTIPVEEGPRFRVEEVRFEGIEVLDRDEVSKMFALAPGEVYTRAAVDRGLAVLREAYGRRGYVGWTGELALEPDTAERRVTVHVRIREGHPYRVGRIALEGHRRTRDDILRRRLTISEGDRIDTDRVRRSVDRLNALGFIAVRDVQLETPPDSADANIRFVLERRNPLRYGLAGGYTELYKLSLSATLGAVDLLGQAESFWFQVERGSRADTFELAGRKPYVLGSDNTLGFHVSRRRLELPPEPESAVPGYDEESFVARGFVEREIHDRLLVTASYTYSDVDLTSPDAQIDEGRRRESAIGLSAIDDSLDEHWMPHRGRRLVAVLDGVGGPLGGDRDYARLRGRASVFLPTSPRNSFALGIEGGWLPAFGATAEIDPLTSRNGLPFDQRFVLGGERVGRGFPARSVGPRDAEGRVIGGDKFLLLTAEHHVDLLRGVRVLAFADATQAYAERRPIVLGDLLVSTGLELRVTVPRFKLPVRLIAAFNPRRDPQHGRTAFKVAVGAVP